MLTEAQKLEALTNLGIELNQIGDLDLLLEKVLSEARRFTNADAGSIYLRDHDQLLFSYTQNSTLEQRLPPGGKLIYSIFSIPIDQNSIAGYVAVTGRTLRLDDVYRIDSGQPYNFSRKFDKAAGYETKSMLTVPLVTHRGDVVGVIQIINALDEFNQVVAFQLDDEKIMYHFAATATVAVERARMTRAIILRMIRMAEMRDPRETGAHVNRVGSYTVEIYDRWAKDRGLSATEISIKRDLYRMAAMMHDVGKVAISDTLLKKPGRFTPEEYEIIKTHTILGARLFIDRQSDFDDVAAEVALNHHERWDGLGYPGHVDVATGLALPGFARPDGLARGKVDIEIPLSGRIVAIADVYDALCSRRSYKPAWEESEALAALEKGSGTQFDPELMATFFEAHDVIQAIRARYPDQSEENH